MPEINEPLLREVLGWIEVNQHLWDQGAWAQETDCGTSYCLAGWAIHLATGRLLEPGYVNGPGFAETFEEGRTLLGLTNDQARLLFLFTAVVDGHRFMAGCVRRPTFAELCERVEEATGVRFKPLPELEEVPA